MKNPALPILLALAFCRGACAGVLETSPNSFTVESSVVIPAAVDPAYAMLTGAINAWWDPAHTWSGDAKNLGIDARAGGCFCEKLPNGGSVEHARVVFGTFTTESAKLAAGADGMLAGQMERFKLFVETGKPTR